MGGRRVRWCPGCGSGPPPRPVLEDLGDGPAVYVLAGDDLVEYPVADLALATSPADRPGGPGARNGAGGYSES